MDDPGYVNIKLRQSATFRFQVTYKVGATVDTAVAQDIHLWTGVAVAQLPTGDVTFQTGDGSLTLGADGSIKLFKDAATTAALAVQEGNWYLKLTPPGGDTFVLLVGTFSVVSEEHR